MSHRVVSVGQEGFSLVGLMVAVSIMLIMMSMAVPSWDYVVRSEREKELLYRGCRIATAIAAYQLEIGGPPSSIDQLVRGKYLRKAWTDPMTKDGKWRLLRPGDPPPGSPGTQAKGQTSQTPGQSSFGTPQVGGQLVGVASLSEDKSLRVVNGRNHYNEWQFLVNAPVLAGRNCICNCAQAPPAPGSSPTQ